MRHSLHPQLRVRASLARLAVSVVLLAPASLAPASLAAQAGADRPPLLGARDAAIAGGFALGALAVAPLDRHLADRLQRPAVQQNRALAATAVGFRRATEPGLYVILPTLWAVGRLADDRTTAAIGVHGAESLAIAAASVGVIKVLAGRARPSVPGRDPTQWRFARGLTAGGEYRSFPSGHTAAAFAAASLTTAELAARHSSARWSVGLPLHAAAAAVGWSRMYENRHWASDVVGGAAIGTLSGLAVARYHRTRPDNAIDRRLLGIGVTIAPGGPRLALTTLSAPARSARRATR